MCTCASEPGRPRLFNCVSVVLVTFWVLIVTVVAHTAEVAPAGSDQTVHSFVQSVLGY